jgi:glycosyltransferase involved in cell wall biosynthesis
MMASGLSLNTHMRITLVTDTYVPSVNGVVTTLINTVKELESRGHIVQVIEPSQFKTVPAPGYKEIRLSWNIWRVGPMIEAFKPDAIHIATEGPLGFAARWYCKVDKRSIPHNTSYHTKFPEYFNRYIGIPVNWGYWFIRWFHKFSTKVLVTNETMMRELGERGFERLAVWNRGVDTAIFNPQRREITSVKKPIILCVSRASIEKGLDDFCSLKIDGTKILVGDGPYLEELKRKYPHINYAGYKSGIELAEYYASADVFVFPSKIDTFGVVMLESIACGTPVAAYPVTGPTDIIINGINGYMDNNLENAVKYALTCNREVVHETSKDYTWEKCTASFVNYLRQIN